MSLMNTQNKGTAAVVTTPAIAARVMQIAQMDKNTLALAYHAIQDLLEEHQDAEADEAMGLREVRDCLIDLSMIAFYCAQLAKE